MRFLKSIDVENEIRIALSDYLNVYCRPLPKDYALPNILVTQVGLRQENKIDYFEVVLDSRSDIDEEALDYLNTAVGILKQVAKEQTTELRKVTVNTSGSWGLDPVRPDLKMCSARLQVEVHQTIMEV